MRLTLLHAFGVILTVLLFVGRRRCAPPGACSEKRRGVTRQGCLYDARKQQVLDAQCPRAGAAFHVDWIFGDPKYKRDPEIDVDNESIGHYPMG